MKKVLVTGSSGMLAKDLIYYLHSVPGYNVLAMEKSELDITNSKNVEEVFLALRPDYVIHTAAITNVDFCEENFEEAINVNGFGSENIAKFSQVINAKLVYISSCGLFGDDIRAYEEIDPVELKTGYAKSKYLGEIKTKENCERYFIVRPGWLFGGNKSHKKNFVYNRYLEALNKDYIYSASDKYGCPTYTYHLASILMMLLDTECYGLYHITNSGFSSRYAYVKKIIECFGLKTKVIEVDSNSFTRKAPVPDCEILKNQNLLLKGFPILPPWDSAIEEYVARLIAVP